ncbi:Crp/Fnr family transcriptional regulator [Sphingomonas aerophila]|uniref:CRP-like cAMP-binding protein n=1 Tax=Sphingomonas aerophila TaxID=1344948 RepID=A0A7W9BG10_9SPHN|nr:Crp/Fnr family transcriptional regulator [Sphingomonas aerophila]MBB5716521.1 CRP-like cAMP-binding protein [Sphingomonas aerophila]
MALTRFVEQLERLGPLSEPERQTLRSLPGRFLDAPANLDFADGISSSSERILVVVDGLLASCYDTVEGERQLTALHVPGDLCDLNTLILASGPLCLTALAPSRVFAVARGAFIDAMQRHPGLIGIFWRYSSSRVLILNERIVSLGSRDARQSLCHLICELAVRQGLPPGMDTGFFHLPMKQHQLASILGLTYVHVNRTLRALREDRLVLFQRQTVTITDWARLTHEASFDPGYLMSYLPEGQ